MSLPPPLTRLIASAARRLAALASAPPLQRIRRHWLLATMAAAAIVVLAAAAWAESCGFDRCPSAAELRAFRPDEGGQLLDRRGVLLGHLRAVRRIDVPLARVPWHVRAAFIAIEDRRFYRHHGVDWHGAGRALWRNVSHFDVREGSSTLTMQAARSAFLGDYEGERSIRRKLIELALTRRLERALTKAQILELYLNAIYLGDATYGVEAASRHYFGKSAALLTLAEGATLAALPRAPSSYEPRRHPDRAVERRNLVLRLMADQRLISRAAADEAAAEQLQTSDEGWRPADGASYAVDLVRAFVDSALGDAVDRQGDIVVRTTFDARAQRAAEQAVRDRAAAIGRAAGGQENGSAAAVEGAMVALDPRTGELRAIVGGTSRARGGFNRAIASRRQPGSAFKPFVYAAALEAGLTTATMVDDTPVEVAEAGQLWNPGNFGDDYGGPMTLRHAVMRSANAATVRVSQRIGIRRVTEVARRLGVTSPLRDVPSVALGSLEVTPIELVTAYAPFANGGRRVRATFVRSVTTSSGRLLWRAQLSRPVQVLDQRDAYRVTSLLRSAVDEGTGRVLRELGITDPVAGKTGTTNNGADVWFVGYTPTVVAGVWFGYDVPRPLGGGGASGGRLAAPAWASFYRRGWRDGSDWVTPAGMVSRVIDDETGMLAGEWCPVTRHEWFKAGSEPGERCTAHGEPFDEIARDMGRLVGRVFRRLLRQGE